VFFDAITLRSGMVSCKFHRVRSVMLKKLLVSFSCFAAMVSFVGCGGSTPGGISFNPAQSAKLAMEDYDENGDGLIDFAEADKCPAIKVAFKRIDSDGNESISYTELRTRIEYFITADSTIISGEVEIKKGSEALKGAVVTFTPERFMGNLIKASKGVTDADGIAYMSGQESSFPGIYLGYYRVQVSKIEDGQETIDAKYNTETTIGYEATDDLEDIMNVIQFTVESTSKKADS
jgi:hypothetical protein